MTQAASTPEIRSLTQEEARERATLLRVDSYDVAVDLTALPAGPEVRCVSTVTFTCTRPGASTFVDCAAPVVSATLDGQPLPDAERDRAAQGRIRLTGLDGRHELVVETVQADTEHGAGVHRAVDPADGEVYLWTSFEPDEAKHVWACFDQPDLKAPHGFTVTAPAAWTVLSNSGEAQVDDVEHEAGPARRWAFPPTPPLSTYNPVVLAGPFHEVRRDDDTTAGHDLGLFTRRSLAALLDRDADELFTVTAQGLAFFAGRFAMPFPQRRYDQVFLPEFGGAMENYGCVAWSDAFLRRTPPTPAEAELTAKVLLHEMAHMWFGNVVTMRWWDDLWLNEAFAEFACNWAAESATRHTDAWASHLAADELEAYLADQGPVSHPIVQPIRDVEEAASIFDAITYPKGASVLQQLMVYVGEDAFVRGMRDYFAAHAWGNTSLADLIGALAQASGRDLDAWRSGWLERAGVDRLSLETDGDGHTLVARGPEGGAPRPHALRIGSFRRTATGLERAALTDVEVAGERTPVDLPEADLHLVNDDDLTFAITRPDAASRAILIERAGDLPTPVARGVAVATVWDMLTQGDATAVEAVTCLTGVLRRETSDAVLEHYLLLASQAARLWAPDAQRDALMAEAAATSRALAEDPARQQVAARTLAGTATSEGDLAFLAALARDDVDLRWRTLVRRAALAGDRAARAALAPEVEAALAADPDPEAWVRALEVRAAGADPAAKQEVWDVLTVERRVPVAMAGRLAASLWQAGQEPLVAPYRDRYLELMPRLHEGGMIPAMVYARHLIPLHGIDEAFLDQVEATGAQVAPVVGKSALERVDELRRMLRSRAGG